MFTLIGSMLFFAFLAINDLEVVLESMIGPLGYQVLFALTGPTILLSVGCIFVISGIRKLSSPDA
jgi:branched-subunit amino acid transport protein